jgi:serine/threonine protein kinase
MAPPQSYRNALPAGARLQEYLLEQVLGAGGFGVTYLARDTHLEKPVAIKEYLPAELAMRAPDGSVAPLSDGKDSGYRWGLDRFLQEARTLARFSHPNIVRVLRYFEANGTAYMVMEYEKGEPLKNLLILPPQLPEREIKSLLEPLLDGLKEVHAAGFLHRDIKPDNIFVRADGRPVLIDFGAARNALGGETRSLTAVLTPGYAPLEQYSGEGKQGPWTDLYAMGGVVYRAVTGRNPPDAVARLREDGVAAGLAAVRGKYSEAILGAAAWALSMDEKKRPQSVDEWRKALFGTAAPPRAPAPQPTGETTLVAPAPAPAQAPPRKRRWPYYVLIPVAILAALLFLRGRQEPAPAAKPSPAAKAPEKPPARAAAPAATPAPAARLPDKAPARTAAPAAPAAAPETESGADERQRFLREVERQFKAADADRDGYLSRGEAARFPGIAREFERVDRDGDGRISPREFIQARRIQYERLMQKRGG